MQKISGESYNRVQIRVSHGKYTLPRTNPQMSQNIILCRTKLSLAGRCSSTKNRVTVSPIAQHFDWALTDARPQIRSCTLYNVSGRRITAPGTGAPPWFRKLLASANYCFHMWIILIADDTSPMFGSCLLDLDADKTSIRTFIFSPVFPRDSAK